MSNPSYFPQSLLLVSNKCNDQQRNNSNNEDKDEQRKAKPKIIEIQTRSLGIGDDKNNETTHTGLIQQCTKNFDEASFGSASVNAILRSKIDMTAQAIDQPSLSSRISMLFLSINKKSNPNRISLLFTQFFKSLDTETECLLVWKIVLNGIMNQLSSPLKSSFFSPHFLLGTFLMEAYSDALKDLCSFMAISEKTALATISKSSGNRIDHKANKSLAMAAIYFIIFFSVKVPAEKIISITLNLQTRNSCIQNKVIIPFKLLNYSPQLYIYKKIISFQCFLRIESD